MVFLTATLPLSMEEQALAMYGIRKQAVAISRAASTSRNHTKYSVVSNSIAGHEEQLIQFVNALRQARSKLVLIYCQSVEQLEQISHQLFCKAYHAKLDDDTKSAILEDFFQPANGSDILCTTSALTHGINCVQVKYVLHAYLP